MSKKFGSDTFELFFTDLIFSHWSSINKGTDFIYVPWALLRINPNRDYNLQHRYF